MKFLIVVALVATAFAAPPTAEQQAPIVSQQSDISPEGNFQWSYQTGNQIAAQADSQHQATGAEEGVQRTSGSFQYNSPDGTPIAIQYVADENGFQAQGAHLPVAPTPPPIPEAIARSLAWNAAHPEPQEQPRH